MLKTSICEGVNILADLPQFGNTTQFMNDFDDPQFTFERIDTGLYEKDMLAIDNSGRIIKQKTKAVTCQIGKNNTSEFYNIIEIYIPEKKAYLLVYLDYGFPTGTVYLTNVFNFDKDMLDSAGISYQIENSPYGEYLVVDPMTAKEPSDIIKSISTAGYGRYWIVGNNTSISIP